MRTVSEPFLRYFFTFLLFSSTLHFSFQNREKVNYHTIKVADLLSVKVPVEFQKLSDDQIADKIITPRKPLVMYASPNGSADFSVSAGNSARNPWQDSDLKMMAQFQKSNIRQLFTSVNFIQERIVKVNGQEFAMFEFISELKEKGKPAIRKYNHLRYTIKKKNTLIFSFVCPESERPLYDGMAEEIMGSVKF